MAFPLPTPGPTTPADDPWKSPKGDEFAGLEELDRPELDDGPDTEPCLPALEWDDEDGESGVKKRR